MPIKVGNIHEKPFVQIWRSRRCFWTCVTRASSRSTAVCEYRYTCGGCMARAYGYVGDFHMPDPGCVNNLRYWQELKRKVEGEQPQVPAEAKAVA